MFGILLRLIVCRTNEGIFLPRAVVIHLREKPREKKETRMNLKYKNETHKSESRHHRLRRDSVVQERSLFLERQHRAFHYEHATTLT
jgi:hypothetical protein